MEEFEVVLKEMSCMPPSSASSSSAIAVGRLPPFPSPISSRK